MVDHSVGASTAPPRKPREAPMLAFQAFFVYLLAGAHALYSRLGSEALMKSSVALLLITTVWPSGNHKNRSIRQTDGIRGPRQQFGVGNLARTFHFNAVNTCIEHS